MKAATNIRMSVSAARYALGVVVLMGVVVAGDRVAIAGPRDMRITRDSRLSGIVEATSVTIPKGVSVIVDGDLALRAEYVQIDGDLVADGGSQRGLAKAVNIEIVSAGDLVVNGHIRGGTGVAASSGPMDQRGVAAQGVPVWQTSGVAGGDGGSIILRAGQGSTLTIGSEAVVSGGRGADGADALLEGRNGARKAQPESGHAVGGDGGNGGVILLDAASVNLRGRIDIADGGAGGVALASGGHGTDDFVENGTWHPATRGGYAVATGGKGGDAGTLVGLADPGDADAARELVAHLQAGHGGAGGHAEAYPGVTGKTTTDLNEINKLAPATVGPSVPSMGIADEFEIGEALAVGGAGGNGGPTLGHGGPGGDAATGDAADGVNAPAGARSAGGNGSPNNSIGGAGGNGSDCSFGVGGNADNGGDATAGAGGNGGAGSAGCSASTILDTNNGGSGGSSAATGGAGGDGDCCLLADGNGGNAGSATALTGSSGGNAGCCSDGGTAGALIATGGQGGDGDPAGDGGNATTGTAGQGGIGGDCPCPSAGPGHAGGQGGNGGSLTTIGGAGGNDCDSGDGGDGGDASGTSTGSGANAGYGNPGGVGGFAGTQNTSGGGAGSGGGSAGGATTPTLGSGGNAGTSIPAILSAAVIGLSLAMLGAGVVALRRRSGAPSAPIHG